MSKYVKLSFLLVGLLNSAPVFSVKKIIIKDDLGNGTEQLDCRLSNKEKCSIDYSKIESICTMNESHKAIINDDYTIELKRKVSGESSNALEKSIILQGHKDEIVTTSFSEDGKYFVSGSSDGTIRLWEVETGNCLIVLSGYPQVFNLPVDLVVKFMGNEKIVIGTPKDYVPLTLGGVFGSLGQIALQYLSFNNTELHTSDDEYNESILTIKKHANFINKTKDDWSSDVKFYDMNIIYLNSDIALSDLKNYEGDNKNNNNKYEDLTLSFNSFNEIKNYMELAKFIKGLALISVLGKK